MGLGQRFSPRLLLGLLQCFGRDLRRGRGLRRSGGVALRQLSLKPFAILAQRLDLALHDIAFEPIGFLGFALLAALCGHGLFFVGDGFADAFQRAR